MNLHEKFLDCEVFVVLVRIMNDVTGDIVCQCLYNQCYTVIDELTACTIIKDKSGNLYMTYERLRHSDKVYFNPDNKLLTVEFKAKS